MPGTALTLCYLMNPHIPSRWYNSHAHFTDEELRLRKVRNLAQLLKNEKVELGLKPMQSSSRTWALPLLTVCPRKGSIALHLRVTSRALFRGISSPLQS